MQQIRRGYSRRPVGRIAAEPVHQVADLFGAQAVLLGVLRVGGEGGHAVVVFAVESLVRRIADERGQPFLRAVAVEIGGRAFDARPTCSWNR